MFAATLRSDAGTDSPPPLPRAQGELRIRYGLSGGLTRARAVYQQGSLKVRFPKVPDGAPPEAVTINTSGGLTGGDRMAMRVAVDAGAYSVVTGQACERIYEASHGDAVVEAQIHLAENAALDWLPQPTILFDKGRLRRMARVDMAPSARLLAVEGIIFGRTAMAEVVKDGGAEDGWRVRRGGKLVYADTFRLSGDIDSQLGLKTVLAGNRAMAGILYVAPDAADRLAPMRRLLEESGVPAAASSWDGILSVRLAAVTGGALTQVLLQVLGEFRGIAMPRVWTI